MTMMQWTDENDKDASVLRRTDLSPLDIAYAKGSEQLLKQVQRHNTALSDLAERFEKLARDREELNRSDRDYLKAEPARAQAWVEEQAESDDAVVALQEQIVVLQALRERVGSAYHRVRQGNALTVRQREVYEQLN